MTGQVSPDGVPPNLTTPNDAIFLVSLMENDDGDPSLGRRIVDTQVNVSLATSLALPRAAPSEQARNLIMDLGAGAPGQVMIGEYGLVA
jgi:hypothetical protein